MATESLEQKGNIVNETSLLKCQQIEFISVDGHRMVHGS